eukprot:g6110.t1
MRTAATTASPNYRDVSDPELLRYGTPDMILVTQGVKLYVHSSKCAAYSENIREQITHPDPFFGKMLVIKNNRSPKAATALLDTIYSPQKLPGAADLFETCEIAEDYEMDLVLQKIKLGLIKRGSVKILLDALATLKPSSRIPPAVIEAFAEFTLHELSVMPRYEELPVLLRRRIAETRVKILENLLQTQPSMKNVYTENEGIFFRPVPDDEYVEIVKTQEKFTKAKNVIRGVAAFGGRGGSGRSAVAGRRARQSHSSGGHLLLDKKGVGWLPTPLQPHQEEKSGGAALQTTPALQNDDQPGGSCCEDDQDKSGRLRGALPASAGSGVPADPAGVRPAGPQRAPLSWRVEGDEVDTTNKGDSQLFPPGAVANVQKLRALAAKATAFTLRENQAHPELKCGPNFVPCLMPEVGNGYFATVSPHCNRRQNECGSLFVAGVFEGSSTGLSRRAALPNPFFGVQPKSAGKKRHEILDAKGGSLLFVWENSVSGAAAAGGGTSEHTVQFRFYAHRKRKHLYVFEITTDSEEAFELELSQAKPAVDPDGRGTAATGGGARAPTAELGRFEEVEVPPAVSGAPGGPSGARKVRVSSTRIFETKSLQGDLLKVAEAHSDGATFADKRLSRLPASVKGLSKSSPALFLVAFASNTNEGDAVVQNGVAAKADMKSVAELRQIATSAVDDALALGGRGKGNGESLLLTAQKLYREHAEAWAAFYEGGVEIAGEDPVLEKIAMFSLYFLLSSFREDVSWSCAVGGLSTNGYNGHVFFDSELWICPNFLTFAPDIVRTGCLQYRVKTIAGARIRSRERAKKAGTGPTQGARIAWEESVTGTETGPDGWNTVTNEIQSTAGVAIAADHYYRANRGTKAAAEWLYGTRHIGNDHDVEVEQKGSTGIRNARRVHTGYEALMQMTADFWASYVTWEGEKARLLKVCPPDEDAGVVDDDISVNACVQKNLEAAIRWNPAATNSGRAIRPVLLYEQSAAAIQKKPLGEVSEKKGWVETLAGVEFVREKTHLLYDAKADAHLEHTRFDIHRKGIVKQADTILVGYPLFMPMPTEDTFRNDLLYAEAGYNPNSPCMTHSMQISGWLSLKMRHKAKAMLPTAFANAREAAADAHTDSTRRGQAIKPALRLAAETAHKAKAMLPTAFANAHGDFRIWTEYPARGVTNFLTGMGGFLQTMTNGMAGVRLQPDGMLLSPNLIGKMTGYVLRGVWFLGCQLRVEWGFDPAMRSASGGATGAGPKTVSAMQPMQADQGAAEMKMKYVITVMKCRDDLLDPFPVVARWYHIGGAKRSTTTSMSKGKAVLKLTKKQHAFDAAHLRVDLNPDFGDFRALDRENFPSVLLQHRQDVPRWPDVDRSVKNEKKCGRGGGQKQAGIDCWAHGIAEVEGEMGTAEECQAACEQAAECQVYTYVRKTRKCLFKKKECKEKASGCCDSGRCTMEQRKLEFED